MNHEKAQNDRTLGINLLSRFVTFVTFVPFCGWSAFEA